VDMLNNMRREKVICRKDYRAKNGYLFLKSKIYISTYNELNAEIRVYTNDESGEYVSFTHFLPMYDYFTRAERKDIIKNFLSD
jgi:hypothetical protein